MSKKLLTTVSALAFITITSQALANDYQPYVGAEFGVTKWNDQSNSDEVESGGEESFTAPAVFAGVQTQYGRIELEAAYRQNKTHGRNRPHLGDKATADGSYIRGAFLGVNVWPEIRLHDRVAIYAGGGGGLARISAFGDADLTPYYQLGAGLTVNITDSITADAGWRRRVASDTKLNGYEAGYDTEGPMIKFTFKF